jgi:hypothetical protein
MWRALEEMSRYRIVKHEEDAILAYMTLHIKGFGSALSDEDIRILNNLSDAQWKGLRAAIRELGGN